MRTHICYNVMQGDRLIGEVFVFDNSFISVKPMVKQGRLWIVKRGRIPA